MLRVGIAGLGKMGLSHYAMINAHPHVVVAAVCDSAAYLLGVLHKYTGVRTYADFTQMLDEVELDAVVIATPTSLHTAMVRAALERGLHVFSEKPLCLSPNDGVDLVRVATERSLVNQVGYHYRFVGAFQEVKRLLDLGAIGEPTHILAEAYGPVVTRPKGTTWRSRRSEGGGCLYDYAAHPLNLINWYFGAPDRVSGAVLKKVFSKQTEDEVYGTLHFEGNKSAQIAVNWSDESRRKMTTQITVWGTNGRIYADRQECQVYLRGSGNPPDGYRDGWNVRYTTELTPPVWFYLRGEEYAAQLAYFVGCIDAQQHQHNINSFATALATDQTIAMLLSDAQTDELAPSVTRTTGSEWLRHALSGGR